MRRALILIAAALLVSCHKNDEDMPPNKTVGQLLTQRSWMISSAGFDDNGNGVIDPVESLLTDCVRDNAWIYNVDGTGTIEENANVCTPSSMHGYTWILKNNDTEIEINSQLYSIVRITENELVLKARLPGLGVDFFSSYFH